jgi:hypothetical protein
MRLSRIDRYPVKGMSPDTLRQADLEPGRGLAFDRAAGFTSGNLADPPRKGGWVRARTFLQLTVYPELARFRTAFDEAQRTITLTAPDGAVAQARLGEPDGFAEANALIRRHFAPGPHGRSSCTSRRRTAATGISPTPSCRCATSRRFAPRSRRRAPARSDAVSRQSLPGGPRPLGGIRVDRPKLRIGGAELEIMRPVMRCAATSVDPERGNVDVDVPELLHRSFGHMFLAVYARVTRAAGPSLAATP